MKHGLTIWLFCFFLASGRAQEVPGEKNTRRSTEVELNNYFFSDAYIFMPVVKSNLSGFHVEGRYNYEDLQTVSFWLGYHVTGGKKVAYDFCPMFAGVAGNTTGFAPGFEITLEFGDFEFYSENEYVFDPAEKPNNFFYNWSDLTYSPNDWIWLGITGQRTRLFKNDLDIQRGFLGGITYKKAEAGIAFYNLLTIDRYILFMLNFNL